MPKLLNQDRAEVPGDYLATLDLEDPARPDPVPFYTVDFIPSITDVDSLTYPVTADNIDLTQVAGNLSEILAVRDNNGKPVKYDDLTDTIYNASISVSAQSGASRLRHFVQEYNADEEEDFLSQEDEEHIYRGVVGNHTIR